MSCIDLKKEQWMEANKGAKCLRRIWSDLPAFQEAYKQGKEHM